MRFLVIGASGFIGSHIFSYLRSQHEKVVGTKNSSDKNPELVRFDITKDKILDVFHPNLFIGDQVCAIIAISQRQIDYCKNHKKESHLINVTKTCELIDELKGLGAKPVYLSSSFVFDGKGTGFYVEEDKRSPVCEYGRQKVLVEDHIREQAPESLVIRLDKIISDNPFDGSLLSEWDKTIKEGKVIRCMKGQYFNPTLVDDVAKALVLACKRGLTGVYHLANDECVSREELARRFIKERRNGSYQISICGFKELGFSDNRPLRTALNSERLVKATGISFTPLDKIIKDFYENRDVRGYYE